MSTILIRAPLAYCCMIYILKSCQILNLYHKSYFLKHLIRQQVSVSCAVSSGSGPLTTCSIDVWQMSKNTWIHKKHNKTINYIFVDAFVHSWELLSYFWLTQIHVLLGIIISWKAYKIQMCMHQHASVWSLENMATQEHCVSQCELPRRCVTDVSCAVISGPSRVVTVDSVTLQG